MQYLMKILHFVKLCNYVKIPLWTTYLIEMMIALNSFFPGDQNQPKDHSNRIRESVLMKESPHMHIWTRSTPMQIGHPWKPINTSDVKLFWRSPNIFFFSSSLIGSHRSEVGMTKEVFKRFEITRSEARICFRILG